MTLKLSIGCDPELFLRDVKTGAFISAHDRVLGTKTVPHRVKLGAVQVDGVAAEINIDPAFSSRDFVNNIWTVRGDLQTMIDEGLELVAEPSVTFPSEYFKNLPPDVRELGCNPDFNGWTEAVNGKPNGDVTTMRTGAGHIHLGWYNDKPTDPTDRVHFDDCCIVAKQLDYYLGVYSLLWDSDTSRRSLYGKAGAFRPKKYGMEYRSLSNVWMTSKELQSWIWNATYKAFTDVVHHGKRADEKFGEQAIEIINGSLPVWTDKKYERFISELMMFTELQMPPCPTKLPLGKTTKVRVPTVFDLEFGQGQLVTHSGLVGGGTGNN